VQGALPQNWQDASNIFGSTPEHLGRVARDAGTHYRNSPAAPRGFAGGNVDRERLAQMSGTEIRERAKFAGLCSGGQDPGNHELPSDDATKRERKLEANRPIVAKPSYCENPSAKAVSLHFAGPPSVYVGFWEGNRRSSGLTIIIDRGDISHAGIGQRISH